MAAWELEDFQLAEVAEDICLSEHKKGPVVWLCVGCRGRGGGGLRLGPETD